MGFTHNNNNNSQMGKDNSIHLKEWCLMENV